MRLKKWTFCLHRGCNYTTKLSCLHEYIKKVRNLERVWPANSKVAIPMEIRLWFVVSNFCSNSIQLLCFFYGQTKLVNTSVLDDIHNQHRNWHNLYIIVCPISGIESAATSKLTGWATKFQVKKTPRSAWDFFRISPKVLGLFLGCSRLAGNHLAKKWISNNKPFSFPLYARKEWDFDASLDFAAVSFKLGLKLIWKYFHV